MPASPHAIYHLPLLLNRQQFIELTGQEKRFGEAISGWDWKKGPFGGWDHSDRCGK
jgi:hypothetical protein